MNTRKIQQNEIIRYGLSPKRIDVSNSINDDNNTYKRKALFDGNWKKQKDTKSE